MSYFLYVDRPLSEMPGNQAGKNHMWEKGSIQNDVIRMARKNKRIYHKSGRLCRQLLSHLNVSFHHSGEPVANPKVLLQYYDEQL